MIYSSIDQNCDVIALPQTMDKFESSKSYTRNSMIATLLRTTLVPISMILVNSAIVLLFLILSNLWTSQLSEIMTITLMFYKKVSTFFLVFSIALFLGYDWHQLFFSGVLGSVCLHELLCPVSGFCQELCCWQFKARCTLEIWVDSGKLNHWSRS